MSVSRRAFLETAALGSLAAGPLAQAASNTGLPTRTLGKTGVKVSILAFGGGSRFTSYKEEDKAVAILTHAFDLGINYIDTADDYGVSEEWYGKALKAHGRKGIFVATKISNRDGAAFNGLLERSLKRLGIDQVDLVHLHDLANDRDLARIEAPGGVLEMLMKAKEQKLTRFIGVTCHRAPVTLQKALERHDFDCTQMALNAAQASMQAPPNVTEAFENTALPVAVRKKMGIIAMKIFAQDTLPKQAEATPRNLLHYTLSLPVAAAVVGMPKPEYLEENVQLARSFKPLPKSEMQTLSQALSKRNKASLDLYFRDHIDA